MGAVGGFRDICNSVESIHGGVVSLADNPGLDHPVGNRLGAVLETSSGESCAGTLLDQGAGFTDLHRCCDLESVCVHVDECAVFRALA